MRRFYHNPNLFRITCHVTHRQILEDLMTGLDTRPQWGTRRFLHMTNRGTFEARLGETTVLLGADEAEDLCDCVDDVCHTYKNMLIQAEDALETWDYLPQALLGYQYHGFNIFIVPPWLWELMLRFAEEFDFLEGTTSWHIFDKGNNRLRILYDRNDRKEESAVIYPHYGPWDYHRQDIDLIYCIDEDESVAILEEWTGSSWNQAIGPKGRWTARYTAQWLRKEFIPNILQHYAKQIPKQYKRTKDRILEPPEEIPSLAAA
jgi:hypothetical protein